MTVTEFASALGERFDGADVARDLAFLIVISTVCYLAVIEKPVPAELTTIVSVIIGYYFRKAIENGKVN